MEQLRSSDAAVHTFNNGAVTVNEFNFTGDSTLNDAKITITGRYPESGYAVNDISTALLSVEDGRGEIVIKGNIPNTVSVGDRLLIKPGEPYAIVALGQLVLRYIATPAWTPDQAHLVD